MSAETRYKCDVCRSEIKSDGFYKEQAFAFKWTGSKNEVLTTQGTSPHRDAPLHLCISCIRAIAKWDKERT
jgi:hypothetical protein